MSLISTFTDAPATSLRGRLARLPLRLLPRHRAVRIRSGVARGLRWVVGAGTHGCWLGRYERDVQGCLHAHLKPGMVVWDVGAHSGYHTLGLAHPVGSTGRVVAFEPFAENTARLLHHVELNGLEQVVVVQAALAGATELIGFRRAEASQMGHLDREESSYLVPATTPDEFLLHRPDARPDLLKIDVEGAEVGLLEGATNLLKDHAPILVLSLHGAHRRERCTEILGRLGYRLSRLDGSALPSESWTVSDILAMPPQRAT